MKECLLASLNRSELAERTLLKDRLKQAMDINVDLAQVRDLGYWQAHDYDLLQWISSVNLPCLVHDGQPTHLIEALARAKQYHCAVGAHIAYPDPVQRGYQAMALPESELEAWILVQLGALQALVKGHGGELEHVRPHGALYQRIAEDKATALTVGRAVKRFDPWLRLVGPAGESLQAIESELDLIVSAEFYVGKRYLNNGQLDWSRLQDDLPLRASMEQVKQLVRQGSITGGQGQTIDFQPIQTLHISPSNKQAFALARQLRQLLKQPLPMAVAAAYDSGWVNSVDERLPTYPVLDDY